MPPISHFHSFKKIILAGGLLLSLVTVKCFGQYVELTPLAGYTLQETFATTDAYEVTVGDGFTWGGSLAFYPDEHFDVALTYMRQGTSVDVWDYIYNSPTANNVDASVNYIMLGGDRNQPIGNGKSYFFGGLDLGAAGLEPKGDEYTGRWKFALDFHAGAKIFPSDNIGIRLQAGINFPVQYFGAAFTVGTGGTGAGVTASSGITQVCFLGGLCFRIDSQK